MTDRELNSLIGGTIVGIIFMSVMMLVADLFFRVPF